MRNNESVGQVILDVDGVVTKDKDPANPAFDQIITKSLQELGVNIPTHQEIMVHWGTGPRRIFLRLLEESFDEKGIVEEQRVILREEGGRIFDEVMDNNFDSLTTAIPGVKETTERLIDKGIVLAVNSASEYRVLKNITFPKAGINISMFNDSLIMTSDRLTEDQEKPCPYPVNQIVRLSGVPKSKTVMVGDSPSDIYCANEAGVTPVVVLTGNIKSRAEAEAHEINPDHIIESLPEIDDVIYRSLGWAGLTNCGVSCRAHS